MLQRPTRAAHDSRASTQSVRDRRPVVASDPGARPAPTAPARLPMRARKTSESACATVPGRHREVQRFLYTDFVLTRLGLIHMKNLLKALPFLVLFLVPAAPARAQVSFEVNIVPPPRWRPSRIAPQPGPAYVWCDGYWYPVGR